MDASFLILLAFFGVMYLLMIRPQQKRQREHQQMISSVTVGTDVVTIGGLHGTVTALDEDTVDLTVSADGTLLRFQRSAIAKVVSDDDESVGDTGEHYEGADGNEPGTSG
ncbi:MAG: preprotein translocase subunit YajC [Actinobacteria bacterium]|nr:preprotein translocase subunit YajC [Actinomycetota bacterium]